MPALNAVSLPISGAVDRHLLVGDPKPSDDLDARVALVVPGVGPDAGPVSLVPA